MKFVNYLFSILSHLKHTQMERRFVTESIFVLARMNTQREKIAPNPSIHSLKENFIRNTWTALTNKLFASFNLKTRSRECKFRERVFSLRLEKLDAVVGMDVEEVREPAADCGMNKKFVAIVDGGNHGNVFREDFFRSA